MQTGLHFMHRASRGTTVKVLLVDDHALFRAGLRMLITTYHGDAVMLEASTIAEALALCDARPDLQLSSSSPGLRTQLPFVPAWMPAQ
jgi:DNA-binding NarL/FixJ family response regulator